MKIVSLGFLLALFFVSSCSDSTNEGTNQTSQSADSVDVSPEPEALESSTDSELEEGDELPPLQPVAKEETLPLSKESLVGTWVCSGAKHITLKSNGEYETSSLNDDSGKWWLQNGVLHFKESKVALTEKQFKDTVKLFINSVTTHKIVLDSLVSNETHEFLCYTGSNYEINKYLYRDRPFEGESHERNIVGSWYHSEGIEFFENGTFVEYGPDPVQVGGIWRV